MKEAYVSYETSKLLKEKGFDWEVFHFYNERGEFRYREGDCYSLYNWNYPTKDEYGSQYCSAPTQQMACRWLHEENGFYVYAVYGDYPTEDKEYWVPELGSLKDFMVNPDFYQEYDSPEDAIEAALQYVLTNLI